MPKIHNVLYILKFYLDLYGEISLRTYVVIYQARLFRYTGYSDRCFYFLSDLSFGEGDGSD